LNSIANNQQSTFNIISQGNIVANSLQDYLQRHSDIAQRALNHKINHIGAMNSKFLTTESAAKFSESASLFLSEQIAAQHIEL
jgi:glutamate racemase